MWVRYVVISLILLSCRLKNDVSGVYVREVRHEFAMGNDSITISRQESDVYHILKCSRILRLRNGVMTDEVEVHAKNAVGVYDESSGVLMEQREGVVYRFSAGADTLFTGRIFYTKVK